MMKGHDRKLSKARNAGALRGCRGSAWDRRPSKRKQGKRKCRNRDPRKP